MYLVVWIFMLHGMEIDDCGIDNIHYASSPSDSLNYLYRAF